MEQIDNDNNVRNYQPGSTQSTLHEFSIDSTPIKEENEKYPNIVPQQQAHSAILISTHEIGSKPFFAYCPW